MVNASLNGYENRKQIKQNLRGILEVIKTKDDRLHDELKLKITFEMTNTDSVALIHKIGQLYGVTYVERI